eukprot:758425-Hanusia_phi.AAC.1
MVGVIAAGTIPRSLVAQSLDDQTDEGSFQRKKRDLTQLDAITALDATMTMVWIQTSGDLFVNESAKKDVHQRTMH